VHAFGVEGLQSGIVQNVHQCLCRSGVLPWQRPEIEFALQRIADRPIGEQLTRKQACRANSFLHTERTGKLLIRVYPDL
jgi:hypothetical protein